MVTAKLFTNGRSQAVRLPKDFRFSGDEVAIKKVGEVVLLYPKDTAWDAFLKTEAVTDCFAQSVAEARQADYPEAPRESL